jgi:hypothetical protein
MHNISLKQHTWKVQLPLYLRLLPTKNREVTIDITAPCIDVHSVKKEGEKAEEQTIESGSIPQSEQSESQPIVLRSYEIPMTEMLVDTTLEDQQMISAAVEEVLKDINPDDLNQ